MSSLALLLSIAVLYGWGFFHGYDSGQKKSKRRVYSFDAPLCILQGGVRSPKQKEFKDPMQSCWSKK